MKIPFTNEDGFTILEVMTSMLIMAFALLLLLHLAMIALDGNKWASSTTSSTQLMQEIEARFPGAARFELFTGQKSQGNLRLYQRLGYQPFKQQVLNDQLTLVYLEKVT